MEKEILEKYQRAYEISEKVLEFAKPLVKADVKAVDIAEKIENKIKEFGGKPAWPVNISLNEIAAHFTPEASDTLTLKENDFVKVDFGVHIDGYIADRAFTILVGQRTHAMIEASEKALEEALKILKPGAKIFEISEVVENIITEFGFNPIRNLCGHGLAQYNQHALLSIPNGKNNLQEEIKEDTPIAMEVFVTNGSGWVKESRPILIYKFKGDKAVRMWEARKILEKAKNEFERLPFCRRWIKNISPAKMDFALRQLLEIEALECYPPLKEESNGLVAVSEDTKIVK